MARDTHSTAANGERPLSESERKAQWEAFERSKQMLFGKGNGKEGKSGKR